MCLQRCYLSTTGSNTFTTTTTMDTIIRDYNQRRNQLVKVLLHKFCVEESRKDSVSKQLETIIDHALTPTRTAIEIKRSHREAFLEVGSVVKNLKKEISVLRHTNAKITAEATGGGMPREYNAEYVNIINQYILANALKKNDYRGLISAYNSPLAERLTDDLFRRALNIVSHYTNVDQKAILSRSRATNDYQARRLLVISILCFYRTTLVELGAYLKKDHSSIIHYIDAKKTYKHDSKEKKKSTLQVQGA